MSQHVEGSVPQHAIDDYAIGDAFGVAVVYSETEGCVVRPRRTSEGGGLVQFRPTRCWDDAMMIADKYQLWEMTQYRDDIYLHTDINAAVWKCNGTWACGLYTQEWGHVVHVEAATGPLAICRLLMKLIGKDDQ